VIRYGNKALMLPSIVVYDACQCLALFVASQLKNQSLLLDYLIRVFEK
jgi:hypothetical protein